jgi:hypothetical protein
MSSILELASQASWYCTPTRFVLIVGARTANKNIFFRYPLLQTQVYDGLMNLYVRHGIYLQLQTKLRMYSWKYYFLSLVAANVILHLHFFGNIASSHLLNADVLLNGYLRAPRGGGGE